MSFLANFNHSAFLWIHSFAGRNVFIDDTGIFLAEYLPYILAIWFLFIALRAGGWRRKIYLLIEGALAVILSRGIITEIIHAFYNHPRPFAYYNFTSLISESGSSFPSGHMTFFFALAMIVFYAEKKTGIWYLILAAIVGAARIYVGVHWPLDIIGGAVIGILSGMFIHWILRREKEKLDRQAAARAS